LIDWLLDGEIQEIKAGTTEMRTKGQNIDCEVEKRTGE
jgi:hypothetical protein